MLAFIASSFTRSLSFTIAFTLCTEVIAQHRTENEILLRLYLSKMDKNSGCQSQCKPSADILLCAEVPPDFAV